MSLKHYVEFYFPGIIVMESSILKIKSRKEEFKIPDGAYGYRFFDKEEVKIKGEILEGRRKNWSGTYYFGEVLSLKELKERFPDEDTLIHNMEMNDWEQIVRTTRGIFQPFEKGDKIIKNLEE